MIDKNSHGVFCFDVIAVCNKLLTIRFVFLTRQLAAYHVYHAEEVVEQSGEQAFARAAVAAAVIAGHRAEYTRSLR